jgi:hypothetical protein
VDGIFGTWTYILTYLYPLHVRPELTLESVYMLLPVVHKYDFPRLLAQLMDFMKKHILEVDHRYYNRFVSVVDWLALAERLQLDELRELCLGRLRGMTRRDLLAAITVKTEAITVAGNQMRHGFCVREEVKGLGQALCFELLAITATAALSDEDDE